MPEKTIINPSSLPQSAAPLSRAIKVGDLVFVSGIPASPDPATGALSPDIQAQVRSCLETIQVILQEAGTSLSNVVAVTTYLEGPRHVRGLQRGVPEVLSHRPPHPDHRAGGTDAAGYAG